MNYKRKKNHADIRPTIISIAQPKHSLNTTRSPYYIVLSSTSLQYPIKLCTLDKATLHRVLDVSLEVVPSKSEILCRFLVQGVRWIRFEEKEL